MALSMMSPWSGPMRLCFFISLSSLSIAHLARLGDGSALGLVLPDLAGQRNLRAAPPPAVSATRTDGRGNQPQEPEKFAGQFAEDRVGRDGSVLRGQRAPRFLERNFGTRAQICARYSITSVSLAITRCRASSPYLSKACST